MKHTKKKRRKKEKKMKRKFAILRPWNSDAITRKLFLSWHWDENVRKCHASCWHVVAARCWNGPLTLPNHTVIYRAEKGKCILVLFKRDKKRYRGPTRPFVPRASRFQFHVSWRLAASYHRASLNFFDKINPQNLHYGISKSIITSSPNRCWMHLFAPVADCDHS